MKKDRVAIVKKIGPLVYEVTQIFYGKIIKEKVHGPQLGKYLDTLEDRDFIIIDDKICVNALQISERLIVANQAVNGLNKLAIRIPPTS